MVSEHLIAINIMVQSAMKGIVVDWKKTTQEKRWSAHSTVYEAHLSTDAS